MSVASRLWIVIASLAIGGASCTDLPAIARNTCGNAVVEPSAGEDCDLFSAAPGAECRKPGQPGACRYACALRDDGTRPACPDGMGCAADGICRWASGGFAAASAQLVAAPRDLTRADFDGDGRQDLVIVEPEQEEIGFFTDQMGVETRAVVPSNTQTGAFPAIGEISGDSLPDLLVSYREGVVGALGSRSRSFPATAHSTLPLPADIESAYAILDDVLPDKPGKETVLLALSKTIGISGLALISQNASDPLLAVGFSPDKLSGDVLVGNLDEDPVSSPCDEIVLPFTTNTQLVVFSPCTNDPVKGIVANHNGLAVRLKLVPGSTVSGPAAFVDANQDGHLDIVVVATQSGEQQLELAYGLGDGTFSSSLPLPAVGDNRMASAAPLGSASPLAIADLDGDGAPDYVDATGVYLRRGASWKPAAKSTAAWSAALVGDPDADGVRDVVAAFDGKPGAEFLRGTGDGRFVRYALRSTGPLSHLETGDFDGDSIPDVVASESGPDGDAISVMFGNEHGSPGDAQRIGNLEHVVQIAPSSVVEDGVEYGLDSITVESQPADGPIAFGGFIGQSDRQLRAPFTIAQTQGTGVQVTGTVYATRRMAIGRFDGDDHGDIAELADGKDGFRLFLIPTSGSARIAFSDVRSSDPLPPGVDWASSLVAAGDLDGDGIDELVVMAPRLQGSGSQAWVARSVDAGDGGRTWQPGTPVSLDHRFGGRLRITDLDHDGKNDVVALAPADNGESGTLVVFPGTGAPTLGKAVTLPRTPDGPPAAFAVVQADRDPDLELALLAKSNVYIADHTAHGWRVGATPVASLDGASLMVAGDFNGDGVDDLALGTADSVAVFAGRAGLP